MSDVLTPIERRIYNYLVDYLKRETYQPSIREIGSRFGIRSTKTVTEHLQSLQRKGYLDRTPSRSRALRILGLDLSPETYTVPLYRNAGNGPAEEVEARFDLDRAFACSPDCFMVRVTGDRLRTAGILDGDLLIVQPDAEARPTQLGVFDRDGALALRVLQEGDARSDGSNGDSPLGQLVGVARAVLRNLAGQS